MMRWFFSALVMTSVLWMSGALAAAQVADEESEPTWEVCNETSFILRTAIAYELSGRLVARGWMRLRPGQCEAVDVPDGETKYIYAESSNAYQGGVREWKGSLPLCTEDAAFTADPADSCKPGEPNTRSYLTIDPGDPRTTFVEPEDYGRRAEAAGLQRLLRDNGYKITRIDGVSGRRTTRTIAQFLTENKLAANLTIAEKVDALELTAKTRLDNVGLTVCNRSSDMIWAAIGRRYANNWESRGWWTIPVSGCFQLVPETLKGSEMHVFARQQNKNPDGTLRTDKTLRPVSSAPSQFCITEARFSALGRADCAANGYEPVDFRAVSTESEGVIINLTDADFGEPTVPGLRR